MFWVFCDEKLTTANKPVDIFHILVVRLRKMLASRFIVERLFKFIIGQPNGRKVSQAFSPKEYSKNVNNKICIYCSKSAIVAKYIPNFSKLTEVHDGVSNPI